MKTRTYIAGALAALSFSLTAPAAQAAPATSVRDSMLTPVAVKHRHHRHVVTQRTVTRRVTRHRTVTHTTSSAASGDRAAESAPRQ